MNQLYRLILHHQNQLYALQSADGKAYPLQKGFLSPDLVQQHLEGKITLGARLLQQGTNTAKAGCVDIDCPRDAQTLLEALAVARKIQDAAEARGLNAYLEFSGARGFHVWVFAGQPLPGKTWIPALKNLAAAVGFQAKEVFPYGETCDRETKSIKLPGGINRKSGKHCGFISDEPEWSEGLPIVPQNQAVLMSDFVQNPAGAIAALASAPAAGSNSFSVDTNDQTQGTKKDEKGTPFHGFHADQHPACIQYLLVNGAPTDQDYNQTNITLARYALSRKLNDDAARGLAESMAKATLDSHPTSKDFSGKISNFKSAWSSAKRNPERYQWGCSYIWGSDELNRDGACIGRQCPIYPGDRNQPQPTGKPWNQLIWKAIQALSERGAEIRASLILAELENVKTVDQTTWEATAADEAAEREALAFILQNAEAGLQEVVQLDIPAAGFISTTRLDIREYLQSLEREKPCNLLSFQHHLERIRDTGLRVVASQNAQKSTKELSDRTQPVPETLDRLLTESQKLLRRSTSEVQPMSAYTRELMGDLFGKPDAAIATPSGWLNNALNGGLAPGRFYVIGAPPGAGKTTFCGWCADYAAGARVPVLYAAFEMSRIQLWIYSLARLSGINSALIESKRWNDESYQPRETLFSRVTEAARNYHTQIAPRLTILEAGSEHTPARLKGAIAQVRHSLGLDESEPVLVVVDYLQLMLSGDEKLDTAAAETLRVSRIATSLKQLARDTNTACIAISDITKAAYQEALRTGSLDMSALRDSFKIAHAADAIALLQTGKITVGKGDSAIQQDQLQLAALKYPEKARLIEQARLKTPLNQASKDTYARLSILKNRGGMLADPLFVYQKALHRFQPIDLDLGETSDDEAI